MSTVEMEALGGMSIFDVEKFTDSYDLKIAIVSDLHLDSHNRETVLNNINKSYSEYKPDWILNAGDQETVSVPLQLAKNEIYVPGNHDYYCSDKEPKDDGLKLTTLNADWVVISVTLWSHLKPEAIPLYKQCMADVRYIKNWSVFKNNELHANQLTSLKFALKLYNDKNIIVMTHHSPSFKSVSRKFHGHPLNSAFHNDLDTLILDNPQIKYWVHGHTHDKADYKIGETRIICNPLGYRGENLNYEPVYIEL